MGSASVEHSQSKVQLWACRWPTPRHLWRLSGFQAATWHPSHRPASLDFDAAAQWLGLEVRGHWVKDVDHAEVEFVARHRLGGRAVRLHERSRFVREGGRWYYVDGDMLPVR